MDQALASDQAEADRARAAQRPALDLVVSIDRDLPEGEVWLFPDKKADKPLKDIKRFWSSTMEDVEIKDYRRHDNRHTYASYLVSEWLSFEVVGWLLGHTSALKTKRYAQLADEPLRQATETFGQKLNRSNSENKSIVCVLIHEVTSTWRTPASISAFFDELLEPKVVSCNSGLIGASRNGPKRGVANTAPLRVGVLRHGARVIDGAD